MMTILGSIVNRTKGSKGLFNERENFLFHDIFKIFVWAPKNHEESDYNPDLELLAVFY